MYIISFVALVGGSVSEELGSRLAQSTLFVNGLVLFNTIVSHTESLWTNWSLMAIKGKELESAIV